MKPASLDLQVLAEKTKSLGMLPSIGGLDVAFRSGVSALLERELQSAVSIFSTLQSKFPDYFEIRNNLAVAHFYLGNTEKARDVLQDIAIIHHNEQLLQHNLQVSQ